jgi:multisubunit Na+/H+ antiporter MnhG subunit
MKLDIRLPLGLLFLVFGLLLGSYGLFGSKTIYERSLGIDINLWWGLVMLVFGLAMVLLGRRGERRAASQAASSVDDVVAQGSSKH